MSHKWQVGDVLYIPNPYNTKYDFISSRLIKITKLLYSNNWYSFNGLDNNNLNIIDNAYSYHNGFDSDRIITNFIKIDTSNPHHLDTIKLLYD